MTFDLELVDTVNSDARDASRKFQNSKGFRTRENDGDDGSCRWVLSRAIEEERRKNAQDRYHGEGRDDTGCRVGPRHHGHLHVLVP